MTTTSISRRVRLSAAITIAAACVAVLGACSTDADTGDGGEAGTITVGVDSAALIEGVVADFEAANPGVKVEVVDGGSSYEDFMRTRIAAGTAPDVFRLFPGKSNSLGALSLDEAGVLLDLADQDWAGELNPSQQSLFGVDGKILAVPLGATAIGAVYNDQALEEVGAAVPETWDEVLALCETAKAAGKTAYAIFQKGGSVLTSYSMVATTVYGPDPDFTQQQLDGTATFADSGWVDAFQRQLDMLNAGCFQEGPNGTDYTAATTLVANGQALGVVAFTDVSSIAQLAPEGTTFSMAPTPVDNSGENYMAVADSTGYGINATTKNAELAKKFVAYLASAAGQNSYANAMGGAPALPNDEFVPNSPTQQTVATFVNAGLTGGWPDQGWPNGNIPVVLLEVVQEMFNGTLTPADAAARMDVAFAG